MQPRMTISTNVAIVLLFIQLTLVAIENANGHNDQRIVCYVGTWAVYRPGRGMFDVEHIDPNLCTHLVYAFAGLDVNTSAIVSIQAHRDFDKGGFQQFVQLKRKNPHLKVLIAIGGWNEGAEKYSDMASTKDKRTAFVRSVITFISSHQFDGLDLDWEYPAHEERGGKPYDKENFVSLVKELREAMPKSWLLTAAISANKAIIDKGYDLRPLSSDLDFFNVMCYDYHGNWEMKTGHNAPLYPSPEEPLLEQVLNVNFTVHHLIANGVPPNKITVGVPLYGHTFTLLEGDKTGPGSSSIHGVGDSGPFTNQSGFMGYNEICELDNRWMRMRDEKQKVPYMYRDKSWISYDDPESLLSKAQFASKHGLGGIMLWSLETDDFMGHCGNGKYPLLSAIHRGMETIEDNTVVPMPDSAATAIALVALTLFALLPFIV